MTAGKFFLGVDTATDWLCLAVWSPGSAGSHEFSEPAGRTHAQRIIPALDELLASCGVDRSRLGGICVGTGPGSYTGLRVGIATALGLARGLGVRVSGASTLAAQAATAFRTGGMPEVLVAQDARRGNIYVGHYRNTPDGISTLLEPAKRLLAEVEVEASARNVPLLSDLKPDAVWLAQQALSGAPPIPSYM